MKVNTEVPILFQRLSTYGTETEDTRFMKTKIWLMHTGENLNGSYFSKESVEAAIPSLANTPILAYIEMNSENEKDFSDHRQVLVKEEGQYQVKYIGSAIGVIPSEHKAQFEMRLCDDGVEREFLTVEGLVWQKWNDPADIFSRDIVKSQSMELHDNYEGAWGEDNLYHFTKFSFFGACALGKDVLPAMRSATIEAQFNYDNMFAEIQVKLESFKQYNSSPAENPQHKYNTQGGNVEVDIQELLAKYSLTLEDLQSKEINVEEYSIEELEAKIQVEFKSEESKTDFALTYGQLKDEIRAELYKEKHVDQWGYEYTQFWYVDFDDQKVIAEDGEDNNRLVSFDYTVNGDNVSINFESKQRVKIVYAPLEGDSTPTFEIASQERLAYELNVKEKEVQSQFADTQKELDETKSKFEALETEVVELKQFKQEQLDTERSEQEEALFEMFSAKLDETEIATIKDVASDMSLEEIETQLYILVGKKEAKFSTKPNKKDTVKFSFSKKPEESKTAKPYAHLIQQYTKE